MAFIRAFGGGGIPSALKSAMNAVLNKKFGTSTTYPPTGWPDDVNLLGPLPEKTASGGIASFSDGADDVPVKEAKFYFLPIQAAGTPSPSNPLAITGWTGLTGYQFGKNLFDKVNGNVVTGNIATSSFNDGNTRAKTVYVPIKGGLTYTVSKTAGQRFQIATSEYIPTNGALYTTRQTGNTSSSLTIMAGANDKYLWAWIFLEGTDTGTLDEMLASVQIEVGASATSYEAYSTPTTYPVSWSEHGTIYGGYVDATRGKVVKTHESVNFNDQSLTWTYQNDYGRFLCQNLASYIVHASSNSTPLQGLYSESYQRDVAASSSAVNKSISCSTLGYLFVYDSGYSDVNTWLGVVGNRKIIYPLQTPVEYDITAFIPSTYLGSNNFYSDANGDAEITYRADIDLALAANSSRGLMMASRSIPEDEILNENTEEVENDENIRQDPADR